MPYKRQQLNSTLRKGQRGNSAAYKSQPRNTLSHNRQKSDPCRTRGYVVQPKQQADNRPDLLCLQQQGSGERVYQDQHENHIPSALHNMQQRRLYETSNKNPIPHTSSILYGKQGRYKRAKRNRTEISPPCDPPAKRRRGSKEPRGGCTNNTQPGCRTEHTHKLTAKEVCDTDLRETQVNSNPHMSAATVDNRTGVARHDSKTATLKCKLKDVGTGSRPPKYESPRSSGSRRDSSQDGPRNKEAKVVSKYVEKKRSWKQDRKVCGTTGFQKHNCYEEEDSDSEESDIEEASENVSDDSDENNTTKCTSSDSGSSDTGSSCDSDGDGTRAHANLAVKHRPRKIQRGTAVQLASMQPAEAPCPSRGALEDITTDEEQTFDSSVIIQRGPSELRCSRISDAEMTNPNVVSQNVECEEKATASSASQDIQSDLSKHTEAGGEADRFVTGDPPCGQTVFEEHISNDCATAKAVEQISKEVQLIQQPKSNSSGCVASPPPCCNSGQDLTDVTRLQSTQMDRFSQLDNTLSL